MHTEQFGQAEQLFQLSFIQNKRSTPSDGKRSKLQGLCRHRQLFGLAGASCGDTMKCAPHRNTAVKKDCNSHTYGHRKVCGNIN